jgi:IS5 family transposase
MPRFSVIPASRTCRSKQASAPTEGFEADTAKGRQKDCDAPWTKKITETHYGYKNHAKVDVKNKLVLSYKSAAASVHDSQVLEDLIDDEDEAVFADSAYTSKSSDERLLKNSCQNFIQFKAQRGHPLTADTNLKKV